MRTENPLKALVRFRGPTLEKIQCLIHPTVQPSTPDWTSTLPGATCHRHETRGPWKAVQPPRTRTSCCPTIVPSCEGLGGAPETRRARRKTSRHPAKRLLGLEPRSEVVAKVNLKNGMSGGDAVCRGQKWCHLNMP